MRFVLVHGAMHNRSCWDGVIAKLKQQGHEAHAPTLAGHGEDAGRYFTQSDCVRSVVDYIRQQALNDFVLAGHSFAGIVIPDVAVELSERIHRLVFQNAMVMKDGERIYDLLPPIQQRMFDTILKREGDRANWLTPFNMFRERFINDADLKTARAVYSTLRAVCIKPQLEEINMAGFEKLNIPMSYINFTDDHALPQGAYGWYPRMADRLGACRVIHKPGSHEVCYTNPDVLARALIEAGRP